MTVTIGALEQIRSKNICSKVLPKVKLKFLGLAATIFAGALLGL